MIFIRDVQTRRTQSLTQDTVVWSANGASSEITIETEEGNPTKTACGPHATSFQREEGCLVVNFFDSSTRQIRTVAIKSG